MGKESKEQETAKKSEFKIAVAECQKFEDIYDAKYLSATEFCKMVTCVFKASYADYDGCVTEIDQQGNLTVSAFFNHSEPELKSDGRRRAVSRYTPDDGNTSNETVRQVRKRDGLMKNGDRYYLTDDGKSGLSDFVIGKCIRSDGTINWNNIVADIKVNKVSGIGDVIDTKVSLLDPVKLATLIYGSENEDGDAWDYGVRVMRSLPPMASYPLYKPDYMLAIERVSEKEVKRVCDMVGIPYMKGIDIVR